MVVVGHVAGPFGVLGWIKIHPYTQTPDTLLKYATWWLGSAEGWEGRKVLSAKAHGAALLALFDGVTERNGALALKGRQIALPRSELPKAAKNEYYWHDLVGLDVVTQRGEALGKVTRLLETGANDVLVVSGDRERLIPFVAAVVLDVALADGRITVDWEPDYL